jgi:GDP-mannose 6-dehydrogenase
VSSVWVMSEPVTAAGMAHKGNKVIGVDLSAAQVETLAGGHSPNVEAGLSDFKPAIAPGVCCATTDAVAAVLDTDISFLCVGTPRLRNGKLDLGHLEPVCREIGETLRKKEALHLVVLRSTVLPGTAESIVIPALEKASGKRMGKEFGLCES